ncbi:hypothetical protein [Paenibacillus senegalensis]|uniref:hypothetical protein n=1 Tax=Paenibacillus senegalensis TaxID=1465766 RepID=UPI00031B60A8|nr:hypothetical protein [Paenibacillus senegalensis]
MILETRVLDAETFLHFQRNADGSVTGKLIRIIPLANEHAPQQQAVGTYIEYRTQPCSSIAAAELYVNTLLEELEEQERSSFS